MSGASFPDHFSQLAAAYGQFRPDYPVALFEHLAQLAQAFYRPDSARQRATGGVGLGLYLCRLVAQAHGGSLALGNARPGLEVRVVLPVPPGTDPG